MSEETLKKLKAQLADPMELGEQAYDEKQDEWGKGWDEGWNCFRDMLLERFPELDLEAK